MSRRDPISLLRGAGVQRALAALALAAYAIARDPVSAADVARAAAAYWIVDGLVVLRAAALGGALALSGSVFVLRGAIAIAAGAVVLALPLGVVFGPWAPGRGVLWMLTSALALTMAGLQAGSAVFDGLICRAIRRRVPGEWSFALGAAFSVGLAVLIASAFLSPTAPLGRVLAAGGVAAGLSLLIGADRLGPSRLLRTLPAVLMTLAAVAGCASTESARTDWTKPGASEEQVARDRSECLNEARRVVPGVQGPRMQLDYPRYQRCMAARGYTAAVTD